MSVTPDFVGQIYKDTATGNLWRANSTTAGDWTLEVIAKQIAFGSDTLSDNLLIEGFAGGATANMTEVNLPGIVTVTDTGYLGIHDNSNLVAVRFPNLTTLQANGAYLEVYSNPLLSILDISALETIGDNGSGFTLYDPNAVTDFTGTSLISIGDSAKFQFTESLIVSVNLSSLASVGSGAELIFTENASLVTVNISNAVFKACTIDFMGCALNEATVDAILHQCVLSPLFTGAFGLLGLSGGTNATPSASGLADKATLLGRGLTVQTN